MMILKYWVYLGLIVLCGVIMAVALCWLISFFINAGQAKGHKSAEDLKSMIVALGFAFLALAIVIPEFVMLLINTF